MRNWDINEVMTANEWLDIQDDQEYFQQQKQKAQLNAARGRGRR